MANLFTRPDTFFGVCEALGQDLGFHPNLLCIALAVTVLWHPLWAIEGYLALGAVVLALRLLLPDAKAEPVTVAEAVESANDAEAPVLAKAA